MRFDWKSRAEILTNITCLFIITIFSSHSNTVFGSCQHRNRVEIKEDNSDFATHKPVVRCSFIQGMSLFH